MVEQVKTKSEPHVRFRGFTDEWEEVKLGDVVDTSTGKLNANAMTSDGAYPFFTCSKDVHLTDTYSFDDEALIIAGNGDMGAVKYYNGKFDAYQRTYVLTEIMCDVKYLEYCLSVKLPKQIHLMTYGSAMPYITKPALTDLKFGSPSLDEQQKIGELFQTLDKAIDLSNTQVENLKQQKKALLQRLFPQKGEIEPTIRMRGFTEEWEEVTLGDVAKLKNGYSFKSDFYTDDGSYKILTIGNITGDTYIDTTNTKTISKLPENIQEHQILSVGDILISMTGNVGRVSIVDVDDTLLNQRVGLIDVGDTVDRTFIYQVLSDPLFEANMVDRGQGAAQMNIGKSDIESYRIYTPSLEEQQAIGELFQTLDEQIRLAEDKVSQYKELKQALLQRLFV